MFVAVLLGKNWRAESSETRAHFKALADDIKRKHAEEHPDYQYAPRKPSEKKRRSTARRDSRTVNLSVIGSSASSVMSSVEPPTTAPQTRQGGGLAITRANEPDSSTEQDNSANFSLPVSVSDAFNTMLWNHTSDFITGYDEAGFLTFRYPGIPPVTSNSNLTTFDSANSMSENQSQTSSNGGIQSQDQLGDFDLDIDNYLVSI